jgi:hypothetical protein
MRDISRKEEIRQLFAHYAKSYVDKKTSDNELIMTALELKEFYELEQNEKLTIQ